MLLLNLSPLYIRCGAILSNSDTLEKELENFKERFIYINPEINISYNEKKLILFKINYFKIDDFKKSPDYEFLLKIKIIQNVNLEEKDKEIIEEKILIYKDSNEILLEPRIKNKGIPTCYYCGELSGRREYIIYKLFQKKCEKLGDLIQLSISGIDYINNMLQNPFFNLPKETISDLVIVGKGKNNNSKLTKEKKNNLSFKEKLYPYLLSTGEDGISIYQVNSINSFKKLGYNTLGPTSLWSLFNLACNYEDPELALKEATEGNNELIDLSVGDIYGGDYGGASLCSDIIASSFSKLVNVDNIDKLDKKDIGRALLIFYGFTYAQVASMFPSQEKIDKNIISGDTFNSLELKQMIQVSLEGLTGNAIGCIFSDYSNYFEIIGMISELDKTGLLKI